MEKVRYGIIGVGNIGSAHLESIMKGKVPNATGHCACGHQGSWLRIQKEKYPETDFKIYASGSDLIEKGSVDAVIVATPHYQHPELIQALKRHPRCLRETRGRLYETGQRNESGCKRGECFVHHHVQPENQLSLPEDAGNDPRRSHRHHQKNKLADHRLVPLCKAIMIRVIGGRLGTEKAGACSSINARTSWICLSGSLG